MSYSCSLDLAVDWIKQIADGVRCTICDRVDEGRSRYACGHTACNDCVATVHSCLLCLTPPSHSEILVDEPLTRRVKHVTELLGAFQDTFEVDVFRQHRISEKLKVEKELFPQCIQALQTYCNRRKSFKSVNKRESHCIIPGEAIETPKMDSSKNFVQEWLEKNENDFSKYEPRKVFSDLKVNSPRFNKSPIKKRADVIIDKVRDLENHLISSKTRKRSFKTALAATRSQSLLDKYLHTTEKGSNTGTRRNAKEVRREFEYHEKPESYKKNDKDESGIVIDEDPIIIEDSQTQAVDKDREAWLAVVKASEKEGNIMSQDTAPNNYPAIVESFSFRELACNPSTSSYNETKTLCAKVPFYKRSRFITHKNTIDRQGISERRIVEHKAKDVSITVESSTLVTNIRVSRCNEPSATKKVSVSIQTDPEEDINKNQMLKEHHDKHVASKVDGIENRKQKFHDLCSADVFNSQAFLTGRPDINKVSETLPKGTNFVKINDSDSDSQHELSGLLVVTADIHLPRDSDFIQRATLTEVPEGTRAKQKLAKRRRSPVSSNSSNKENHDPNARKKPRRHKKTKQKKVRL